MIHDITRYRMHIYNTKAWLLAVVFLGMLCPNLAAGMTEGNTMIQQVTINFFYTAGCPGCQPITEKLKRAKQNHPQIVLQLHNLADPNNVDKMNRMYDQYKVPYERWTGRLAVFVGTHCLVNEKEVDKDFDRCLDEAIRSREGAPQLLTSTIPHGGRDTSGKVVHAFERLGIGTILAAGLIDGINPCAFTTLVFFISYLSYLGRSRREIWLTGASFSVGIFVAYLAIGLGLLRAVQLASQFQTVSKASITVIGLGAMVLAAMSFIDYRKATVGEFREMSLQLPAFLKRISHKVIRMQSKRHAIWSGAFLVGAAISILELACTGQIYVPTITYVMSVPEYRERALYYLVAYALMFILPLLVVFFCVGMGVSSDRLMQLSRKHTGLAKLLMSGIFLLLGIFLILQSMKVYGLVR